MYNSIEYKKFFESLFACCDVRVKDVHSAPNFVFFVVHYSAAHTINHSTDVFGEVFT